MDEKLESRARPGRGTRLFAGLALLFVTFAVMFVFSRARSLTAVDWKPMRAPLPIVAGTRIEEEFVAEVDDVYEIELEFSQEIRADVLAKHVGVLNEPSPLDVSWEIELVRASSDESASTETATPTSPGAGGAGASNASEASRVIARGDARDYLYLTGGGESWLRRLRRKAFGVPFHDLDYPTLERGIGRFEASHGARYRVRVNVATTIDELRDAQPHLAVRLNRKRWIATNDATIGQEYAAIGSLGLALACAAAASLSLFLHRRARARSRSTDRASEK